jgi:hypothetical protein
MEILEQRVASQYVMMQAQQQASDVLSGTCRHLRDSRPQQPQLDLWHSYPHQALQAGCAMLPSAAGAVLQRDIYMHGMVG